MRLRTMSKRMLVASCYYRQYRDDEIGEIKASLLRARINHAHDAEHERGADP